uniref:Uncharacterized protein n=1 Tax=Cacopsylla melanoneura TaxID=428564 RepID=A0A8D8U0D0_9HEMI
MSSWSPAGGQGAPSSTVAPILPQEPFTPPSPAPPVKEKLVTKRKLSISEYRQRKGVTSLASTPATTTPPLSDDQNERRGSSSSKGSQGACSPPTSSSSDEEGEGEEIGCHSVGATRVIEKSVLVDNLIAKISKSADSLSENKEFKDPQFTRIPKAPSLLNNNQQLKKPAKPDSFLERPKENLLERLNREFNIRLSDGPPIGLPKPTPPLPPGVMPPPVVPPPIYEDLTSDLYIPIASRSHTPRSLKK